MYQKCRYLRVRHKKGEMYYYCTKRREIVESGCFRGCLDEEFKERKQLAAKKPMNKVSKTNKVTKATSITKKVKMEVWERDNHCCIFCGKYVEWNFANSHYIKRSHNGMGTPKNIMTNCDKCHEDFECSSKRPEMLERAKKHFMNLYDDWNEEDLIYKKYAN